MHSTHMCAHTCTHSAHAHMHTQRLKQNFSEAKLNLPPDTQVTSLFFGLHSVPFYSFSKKGKVASDSGAGFHGPWDGPLAVGGTSACTVDSGFACARRRAGPVAWDQWGQRGGRGWRTGGAGAEGVQVEVGRVTAFSASFFAFQFPGSPGDLLRCLFPVCVSGEGSTSSPAHSRPGPHVHTASS